jgi:hypothetical protein
MIEYEPKARRKAQAGRSQIWPPLIAALICTGLIAAAIMTAVNARANGDLMLMAVPILGATFLSIPAMDAWWSVLKILREK